MPVLEVENIHKHYGKTAVLRGIGFSLEKGEVLSVIGSSGSGKTTLLRCLNFLETPEMGVIRVNGETLFDAADRTTQSEAAIRERRLHFGLVFQQFNLFPQYTVKKNVTLAKTLLAHEMLKKNGSFEGATSMREATAAIDAQAESLLRKVGMEGKSGSYPCELSGGQQQRVAIARALALSPDILCFDEPTSALDPELTGEVLKVIRGLKSKDSTMIVVTHEMAFAENVSDKVLFMADGVIEEAGTPAEVFGNPQSEKTKAFLRKEQY